MNIEFLNKLTEELDLKRISDTSIKKQILDNSNKKHMKIISYSKPKITVLPKSNTDCKHSC